VFKEGNGRDSNQPKFYNPLSADFASALQDSEYQLVRPHGLSEWNVIMKAFFEAFNYWQIAKLLEKRWYAGRRHNFLLGARALRPGWEGMGLMRYNWALMVGPRVFGSPICSRPLLTVFT